MTVILAFEICLHSIVLVILTNIGLEAILSLIQLVLLSIIGHLSRVIIELIIDIC